MTPVQVFRNVLGGQMLAKKSFMSQWRFILYIFLLIVLLISIHFKTESTMQRIDANDLRLQQLRSEYIGKYTRLLNSGKRSGLEQMLEKSGLEMHPPVSPPTRIIMQED